VAAVARLHHCGRLPFCSSVALESSLRAFSLSMARFSLPMNLVEGGLGLGFAFRMPFRRSHGTRGAFGAWEMRDRVEGKCDADGWGW
jgi:hypothetical protein